MRPYYEDDLVTLYHGDCREVDEWQSAAVLVTDPPYGMAYESNRSQGGPSDRIDGDLTTELRDWVIDSWQDYGDRPALVFGTWRLPRPAATKHLLVWDKGNNPGTGDLSVPWGHSHEEVYLLGKGFQIPGSGKRIPNVLRFDTVHVNDPIRADHPTPKPVPLMRHLIERCPPGVIADPFAGSGATLRAAKDLGREAIGVEKCERYCEAIVKRLAQEVLAL